MRDVPLHIDLTLRQAADAWLSQYASANTRAAYSSDLRAFLSWFGDDAAALAATPEAIGQYRMERESSGVSGATVNRQFTALRAFFAAARELGIRDDNPFGTRPGAADYGSSTGTLTPADVARLEAAAALDPRTAVIVQLLLSEGMRLAEVLALDHADVAGTRNAKRLRIVRHGRPMSVTLDPAGSRSVNALERSTRAPGPLFLGPSRGRAGATRLTRFGADHLIKQAATAARIEQPVSANVLRRTHVANAHRDGIPIDEIRQSMGHLDVRTTRRYLQPSGAYQPTHNPEGS
jgi:integrase/recombinase XerD